MTRDNEVVKECTETPLKTGMSGNMSGDGRNEHEHEQISENERKESKRGYLNWEKTRFLGV